MGCDIHVFLEKRNKETNKWEHLTLYKKNYDDKLEPASVFDGRNYYLFGLLAGVRGFVEPLVDPRGIPDDLSDYVAEEWKSWDGDAHTPTWYDFCELDAYERSINSKRNAPAVDDDEYDDYDYANRGFVYFMGNIRCVLDAYWMWYPEPHEVRVIMWFDN